jgi:hypothetical protein
MPEFGKKPRFCPISLGLSRCWVTVVSVCTLENIYKGSTEDTQGLEKHRKIEYMTGIVLTIHSPICVPTTHGTRV